MSFFTPARSAKRERIGKFTLLERLGRGGMAEVWKARIEGPHSFTRTVVLKRMHRHLADDPTFVSMFKREARLSAQLHHASIVQVYDFDEVDGELLLVMEHVAGHNLLRVLAAQSKIGEPLPVGQAAFMAAEVARALEYAHGFVSEDGRARDIIHRDVSPANIMLGYDGSVKLLDFGIAKALADVSSFHTAAGTVAGKIGYAAPEQMTADTKIDRPADVFSLGVVLHEMLTGRRLFAGGTEAETIARVLSGRIPVPSQINCAVPPALDAVCLRALSSRPEERYQNGEELARELEPLVLELVGTRAKNAALLRGLFPDPGANASPEAPETAPARRSGMRRRGHAVLSLASLGIVALAAVSWSHSHSAPTVQPSVQVIAPPTVDPPHAEIARPVEPSRAEPAAIRAEPPVIRTEPPRNRHVSHRQAPRLATSPTSSSKPTIDLRRGDMVSPFQN